ncbi:glycosyltransferase [Vibrio anguillarum]|uniref:glycosyltransferase n=1 Tax=Vibrio anguillarum TaxID=55601 RepID=UPI0030EF14B1
MKSYNPLVSVIISAYNAEKYISEALKSLINQSYDNIEIIIINDGSTDKTLDIINSHKDLRTRVISRPNKGLVYSLNEAIGIAKGELICRMDADDVCKLDRIEKQVAVFNSYRSVDFVFTGVELIDDSSEFVCDAWVGSRTEEITGRIEWYNTIYHPTVMFKKELIDKYGDYHSLNDCYEDKDLWLRFKRQGVNFHFLNDKLLQYRLCSNSIHSNYSNYWYTVSNSCIVNRDKAAAFRYINLLDVKSKLAILIKCCIPSFMLLNVIKFKSKLKK